MKGGKGERKCAVSQGGCRGRNCVIIIPVQLTLEMLLEGGCVDTVEVVKVNESWEGEWNEHVGD